MKPAYSPVGRLHAAWIWFWYWDLSRLLLVLFPGHFLLTLPVMWWFHLDGQTIKNALSVSYVLVLGIAMVDNDYEQLNRIGLDVYRRPLSAGASAPDADSGTESKG
jgi:hypothetical protein